MGKGRNVMHPPGVGEGHRSGMVQVTIFWAIFTCMHGRVGKGRNVIDPAEAQILPFA